MPIRGYASLEDVGTLRLDIALVIDTSGSTKKTTAFDQNKDNTKDTVLEAEVHACRRLVDALRPDSTRFSVVKFARLHKKNSGLGEISDGPILAKQTRIVQDMTKDRAAIHAALDKILAEGSVGGSNTGGGIATGISALENAPPVSDTTGYLHAPLRHIVIVTDGIPTLPIESGLYARTRRSTSGLGCGTTSSNSLVSPSTQLSLSQLMLATDVSRQCPQSKRSQACPTHHVGSTWTRSTNWTKCLQACPSPASLGPICFM